MKRSITNTAIISTLLALGCELAEPRDVMGNFEVHYVDNMRVYINDELVAEVESGEDADIEWDGEIFQVSTLCSDEGVECPSETFWGEAAVDQPWGDGYSLLNFVNLDLDSENPGQRMGGVLNDDGSFDMLSGLGLAANGNCAAIGVGTVTGWFSEDNQAIEDGVITYAWAGGCSVDGVEIGVSFRLETDYSATRVGDYDVSSVTPEEPIDEEGEEVDPERPDEGYAMGESQRASGLGFGG